VSSRVGAPHRPVHRGWEVGLFVAVLRAVDGVTVGRLSLGLPTLGMGIDVDIDHEFGTAGARRKRGIG
jgi:hypothetical protein